MIASITAGIDVVIREVALLAWQNRVAKFGFLPSRPPTESQSSNLVHPPKNAGRKCVRPQMRVMNALGAPGGRKCELCTSFGALPRVFGRPARSQLAFAANHGPQLIHNSHLRPIPAPGSFITRFYGHRTQQPDAPGLGVLAQLGRLGSRQAQSLLQIGLKTPIGLACGRLGARYREPARKRARPQKCRYASFGTGVSWPWPSWAGVPAADAPEPTISMRLIENSIPEFNL